MKKKVMLLMMFIPLVFMLTIYSVTKVVSIVVSIPVSGIAITTQNEEGYINLDLATYNDDLYISAEVAPFNAKNKNYVVNVTGIDDMDAPLTVNSDGLVSLIGVGRAKITVTSAENAFSDSIIVNVSSSKILYLRPSIADTFGNALPLTKASADDYDYTATVTSGALKFGTSVYPDNLSGNAVTWSAADENVLTVATGTGKATANLSGETIVTATADNGIGGTVSTKIKLTVLPRQTASGVTVNGGDGDEILCAKNENFISFFAEVVEGGTLVIDCDEIIDNRDVVNLGNGKYKVTMLLANGHADEVSVRVSAGGTSNVVTAVFADYALGVFTGYHTDGNDQMFVKEKGYVTFFADITPYDSDVTYDWVSSDDSLIKVIETRGSMSKLYAENLGGITLTVTAKKDGIVLCSTVKTVTVVQNVAGLIFAENAKSYGIGDVLALGDTIISGGNYVTSNPALNLKILNADNTYTAYGWSNFGNVVTLKSSDETIAVPSPSLSQFKARVNATGNVTFTAEWKYASYFKETVSASITVKAVKDGVSVNDYDSLKKATDDGKIAVVTGNIMLGKQNANAAELQSFASEMPTTYDWQYYENKGEGRPNVKYLIEFKNNVYGNGYEINGDYITTASDSTGSPLLFKGPLDFVSVPSVASVKGQDNIVFLVRTNAVTLDNVVLKGCSNESLYDNDGNLDLSKLNYVGTTLEIASDVIVKNSRVSNGRTVMRVFGGGTTDGKPVVTDPSLINASAERINVTVDSCILTNAREFIIKTGSNRAVMATGDTAETFNLYQLTKQDGTAYPAENGGPRADQYFYDKYVTTDLTVKDSVLYTSGLFSIGVETHFAGEMLAGAGLKLANWSKLAATSYATALNLEGNVRLLDWKKLDNVDSNTLIETYGTLSEDTQFLKLDISAMINKVSAMDGYTNIISMRDGNKCVHGGIAFYGGGYNYSYLNAADMTSETLPQYTVNLSVLMNGESPDSALYMQGNMLPLASGRSSFRFYMYDGASANDYDKQMNAVNSGEAFKVFPAE